MDRRVPVGRDPGRLPAGPLGGLGGRRGHPSQPVLDGALQHVDRRPAFQSRRVDVLLVAESPRALARASARVQRASPSSRRSIDPRIAMRTGGPCAHGIIDLRMAGRPSSSAEQRHGLRRPRRRWVGRCDASGLWRRSSIALDRATDLARLPVGAAAASPSDALGEPVLLDRVGLVANASSRIARPLTPAMSAGMLSTARRYRSKASRCSDIRAASRAPTRAAS